MLLADVRGEGESGRIGEGERFFRLKVVNIVTYRKPV
jgi:hypothetical protein